MELTDAVRSQLVQIAADARQNAYAPFSKFYVGSAVLGDNGKIYAGVNVENSSYGLTICAERSAATAAITDGARAILATAIVSQGGASPCGACRQFLYEFGPDMEILLSNVDDQSELRRFILSELLPEGFRLER